MRNKFLSTSNALKFVILLGFVSLFADVTYEGAKSISGQYLAILGASGTIVGIVAGFGEFVGYVFRFGAGYLSDKTRRYWLLVIWGYIINLFAVPLLALAGNWELAASLMILERFGKAIRTPAKDALLSYATHQLGRGWGFGLHEAMDQIGAILGPLIVSAVLWYQGSYQAGFAVLLIPALCALSVLVYARILFPHPENLEVNKNSLQTKGLTKNYWIFIAAVSCIAAGYVDFPLIAYHFKQVKLFDDAWIPVIFACGMAADALSALTFGKLYDLKGISALMLAAGAAAFFAPLVFLNSPSLAILGVILWGIGLGAQESVIRAVVAHLIPKTKRGTGYGMFHLFFGIFWFLGSALMGYLYDISMLSLVLFSVLSQLISLPLLGLLRNKI